VMVIGQQFHQYQQNETITEYVQVFYHRFIWVYCRWRSNYQEERVGIPLTGLTLPHLDDCTWMFYVFCLHNFRVRRMDLVLEVP
jgi:hypothetical protein